MSVLAGILKEEEGRLKALFRRYSAEIRKFPKGSLSLKRIRNGEYAYLAYREGKRIKFDYLGVASSQIVKEIGRSIQERRKIQVSMAKVSKNLREVQRMIRAAKA